MNFNFHTHTFRCGHATGTPEEYIKRAIDCGIKFMGFSDHIPYICSNGMESVFRVNVAEVNDYIYEISALRNKYKDKIDIKIGFEMEYYPDYFDEMLKSAINYGGEYLILGQHFLEEEQPDPMGKYVIKQTDSEEKLKKYTSMVVSAIKTGIFTYVAHPDIFNFVGDDDIYEPQIRKLCVASKDFNIPLEINCLGIRDNRHYPNEKFWKIAGEVKTPVTIGFDSHDNLSAYDAESVITAQKIIEKFNLNYIGKPKIKYINKMEG